MDWGEAPGYPQEQIGPDTITAIRQLVGPWAGRHTKLSALFAGGGEVYPYNTAWGIRLRSASVVPIQAKLLGQTSFPDLAVYEAALLTLQYGLFDQERDPDTGDLFSEVLEPRAEFITLDPLNFCWGSPAGDALTDMEAPGRLNRELDYVLTFYSLSAIPAAATSLVGYVNNAPVTCRSLGRTFATETLLFAGATPQRTVSISGTAGWTLPYRFNWKPSGWNRFWRKATQSWESIYVAGGAIYNNYPAADFSALWTW